MAHVVTHDLGVDWIADQRCDPQGHEEMTIRNVMTGAKIELPDESVKLLRKIFKAHS